ncbi:Flavin-dependent halogenase [uncultured Caudovirales phage]|uniref:Flavin-dependent halogenase n=1 Tax=uncultured Caudovirales phage TaxID=2100421 RepID=A0A6J7WEX4_9CAUD|nr:Flavin-dependent halogenase [uncultured Caudovirales phage]CAB5209249.1 Flavin-dependent halogenase [uncultured Caudovirales phage]
MINSICILGGGTSGLVAALMTRKAWPNVKITMIESSKFGIIGVGEGSTEHWRKFMQHVNIDIFSLIRETGATFKIGIKFTNWNGDGKHYFHSLSEQYGAISQNHGLPYTWIKMIGENWDPLDTSWRKSQESMHIEPLDQILSQYHFDTHKLNDYLHRLCRERDINIVDTEVDDVILDEDGYVKELIDVQGRTHAYDFYIDCSGFRRVIASKLGAKWVDCTNQLPMNSAIAFPTGYTEDIPSYTESTALSSGWVWRIPTQERYGNGYVFCDKFIDETKAYDEVSQHYRDNLGIKEELQIGKKVKFGAGYVEEFWMKNCVSIGLSGIFVEPLEASSIGTTIQQCFILMPDLFFYEKGEPLTAQRYNKQMRSISENIVDFIQLHYFTKRDDTEFWRWCKNEIVPTDFNKNYLSYFKRHYPNINYFNQPMLLFSYLNYGQVMHGLGMFDNAYINEKYKTHMGEYSFAVNQLLSANDAEDAKATFFSHRQSINALKSRGELVEFKF